MKEFQSLADLLDLQDVDLQIDRLLHQRSSLPELEQYRAAHDASQKAGKRHAELTESLKLTGRELDKTEGELEILELKLEQQSQRLFAGGLSAREADAMRMDVEAQKRKRSAMEDEVLALLDRTEALEEQLAEAAKVVEQTAEEERRLEEAVAEAWRKIDAEIARRESRKEAIVLLIPEDLLERYEKLRQSKEGVAVSRLADGVCGGCHLTLSAAEQAEVLQDDPPRCLHCLRLLVP